MAFVHESLVADTAQESILSLVSLHVIPVSSNCLKGFATDAAVISRHGAYGVRVFEVGSISMGMR